MLIIKGDENFKISVRHYFYDVVGKIETAQRRISSALDDDVNGAKMWVESENGRRRKVTLESGEQARSPKVFSDATIDKLNEIVNIDDLFIEQLKVAERYSQSFEPGDDVKSYKAKVTRLQNEVEAIYYECMRQCNELTKKIRNEIGDDIAKNLNVIRETVFTRDVFIEVADIDSFVETSSQSRSDRVQRIIDDDFDGKLTEFVSAMSLHGPQFKDIKDEAILELEKLIEVETADPDREPDLRKCVDKVIDDIGGNLSSELISECDRMFEPNDDSARVKTSVVPKVVNRTMLSNHRQYGVIIHLEDKINEMFDGKNW